ncbi:hypothetical protein GCM10027184_48980 [Saccharothrix stipae]
MWFGHCGSSLDGAKRATQDNLNRMSHVSRIKRPARRRHDLAVAMTVTVTVTVGW